MQCLQCLNGFPTRRIPVCFIIIKLEISHLRQRGYGHRLGGGEAIAVWHDPRQPDAEFIRAVSARNRTERELRGEAGRLVQRENPAGGANDGDALDKDLDPRGGHGRTGQLAGRSWPPGDGPEGA